LALEDGGVTFVKLGQVLATRRDLLPEEFVTELSALQDDVSPVSWPAIDEVIRAELGAGAWRAGLSRLKSHKAQLNVEVHWPAASSTASCDR
jgi:predicted unusual protein kinase regulating ubiquinone biosynthesis (AarF/ABC1/UbiB family)